MSKIILFDIETTNLKADFGTCLCVGMKTLGDTRVWCPNILQYGGAFDPTNDRSLLAEVQSELSTADMLVSYYGKCFDVPFLQAKFLEYGLPLLPPIPHVDLYFTVKHNLCISRKSLRNVSIFLDLEARKTDLDGKVWKRATVGHASSIKYVVDHCIADVEVLEQAYLKLRPLVRQHPRVHEGQCRNCGSDNVNKRGFTITNGGKKRQRIQCQDCGAWGQQ